MNFRIPLSVGAMALLWGATLHAEAPPRGGPPATAGHQTPATPGPGSSRGLPDPHGDHPKGAPPAPGATGARAEHPGEPHQGLANGGEAAAGGPGAPPVAPDMDAENRARRARRDAHVRSLTARIDRSQLQRPAIQEAFKVHAWREARLQRLRALALEKKDDTLVKRIDALLAKEAERHERHIQHLASPETGTGTETSTATAPSPGGGEKPEKAKKEAPAAPKGPAHANKEKP